MKIKYYLPLLVLFVGLMSFFLLAKELLLTNGFSPEVLLYGNILLFLVTLLSLFLLIKGMHAKTSTGFLQSVYGSLMGKLFICGIGAFIYFKTTSAINKPAIFVLLGLYIVYTYLEIRSINQLTRDLKNAKATGSH